MLPSSSDSPAREGAYPEPHRDLQAGLGLGSGFIDWPVEGSPPVTACCSCHGPIHKREHKTFHPWGHCSLQCALVSAEFLRARC